LRRKLLEDLERGEKIFVFKIAERNLSASELARLHAAIRAFGPNTLLYVRYADAANPPGTVRKQAPGLLIGYIDQFSLAPSGEPRTPSMSCWTDICSQAYRLWRRDQEAVGTVA
jgi:hypothetical protein